MPLFLLRPGLRHVHVEHEGFFAPQRIRASGLLLLEMILFGSLLLYFPVRF